jgi:hypothetical protein
MVGASIPCFWALWRKNFSRLLRQQQSGCRHPPPSHHHRNNITPSSHNLTCIETKSPKLGAIMWPSRAELTKLMGMDNSQWESASYLEDLLEMLHQQREENINSKRGAYVFAARSMYRWTFRVTSGPSYDPKRKCLWVSWAEGWLPSPSSSVHR